MHTEAHLAALLPQAGPQFSAEAVQMRNPLIIAGDSRVSAVNNLAVCFFLQNRHHKICRPPHLQRHFSANTCEYLNLVLMSACEFVQQKLLGQTEGDMETDIGPEVCEYKSRAALRIWVIGIGKRSRN
jgi:hypothetical protein